MLRTDALDEREPMNQHPNDQFLQAEEEANRLIEELGKLRKETESYASASKSLNQASSEVGKTARSLQAVAENSAQVFKTLNAIGTPELLRAQEEAKLVVLQKIEEEGAKLRRVVLLTAGTLLFALLLLGAGVIFVCPR